MAGSAMAGGRQLITAGDCPDSPDLVIHRTCGGGRTTGCLVGAQVPTVGIRRRRRRKSAAEKVWPHTVQIQKYLCTGTRPASPVYLAHCTLSLVRARESWRDALPDDLPSLPPPWPVRATPAARAKCTQGLQTPADQSAHWCGLPLEGGRGLAAWGSFSMSSELRGRRSCRSPDWQNGVSVPVGSLCNAEVSIRF